MRDPTPPAVPPRRRLAVLAPHTVAGRLRIVFVALLTMAAVNLGVSRYTTARLDSQAAEIQSAFQQQDILWETFGRLDGVRRDVRDLAERGRTPSDSLLDAVEAQRAAIHRRLTRGAERANRESEATFLALRATVDSAVGAWRTSLEAPAEMRARLAAQYGRQADAIFDDLLPRGIGYEEERQRAASAAFRSAAVHGARLNWVIFLASSALTGVILFTLMRRLSTRLGTLETAASRLGSGDLAYRVTEDGDDELGDVARAFNAMSVRLGGALEELAQSESRFRQFFENANDPLFLAGTDGRLVDVNRRACESLGYEREELLALSVWDVDVGFQREEIFELWDTIRPGEVLSAEGVHRRRDGSEFPVDVKVSRFEVDGRQLMLADARDLTQRRKLEEQLLHATKLEAVGRLAGGIAHDFNNVLTAIRGQCQLVLADTEPADPRYAELAEIDRSAERAAKLVKQLLAFGRQQRLDPKPVHPGDVVKRMELMLHRLIDEDIELELSVDEDVGVIHVDAGQLEQVIINLVINARDAMPRGGKLTIALANDCISERAAAECSLPLGPGPCVCLSVEDSGSGIAPDILPHVFEPFFTTKEVGKGSGLGLATAYGIVEQSGGNVQVRSEHGRGARFEIRFPRISETSLRAQEPCDGSAHAPDDRLKGKTVLVVEDEQPVRRILEKVLERSGCSVVSASDGAEALRLFEAVRERLDLVITDVVMPGMGGGGLAGALKTSRPDLPVLFVSGYTRDELESRGARGDLLEKPFTPDELVWKVAESLATRATDARSASASCCRS